jgi:hypothetical protein
MLVILLATRSLRETWVLNIIGLMNFKNI